ncbi:MAG: response regulator, partial [Verrucomicrobiota bacterium]
LNGIIGFANLLSHLTVDEEYSEFVASILSCSQSLQHLINDVLDFTKIEAGEMLIRNQPFTLSDVINEVALEFKSRAEERNLSFNLQIDERLAPTYEGDPIRITQLLNNLLSNAEKFTKAGSISLEVHVKPSDQAVQFLVRDTGIGVQESWLKHLSQALEQKEPFTLERLGGTCLNIATSIKVAEMMGGSIHIEPGIPEGTLSILQLPLNTIKSSEGDSQPEIKNPEFIDPGDQRVRVLAVDDNEVNLKLISFLLKHRQDIEVILSSSGEKALEHLERGAFDAILLDLQMPGLDGFETCNKIRSGQAGSHHKEIPIAALTAHTTTENRKKAQNCAMNAFIEKPMKPKEVFRFLSEFTRAT